MNRAFSAVVLRFKKPGALPQATVEYGAFGAKQIELAKETHNIDARAARKGDQPLPRPARSRREPYESCF